LRIHHPTNLVYKEGLEMKETFQRFGGFLTGMIIPRIGAFIAWGLNKDNLTTM